MGFFVALKRKFYLLIDYGNMIYNSINDVFLIHKGSYFFFVLSYYSKVYKKFISIGKMTPNSL